MKKTNLTEKTSYPIGVEVVVVDVAGQKRERGLSLKSSSGLACHYGR